jgi:hypothetical protein
MTSAPPLPYPPFSTPHRTLAQGSAVSAHPRGKPLYPMPMITLLGPTITAPTYAM